MDKVLEWAKELQSLAQAELFYGHDVYDKERYQRIREIAAEMMLTRTDIPAEKIHGLFCNDVELFEGNTGDAIVDNDELEALLNNIYPMLGTFTVKDNVATLEIKESLKKSFCPTGTFSFTIDELG